MQEHCRCIIHNREFPASENFQHRKLQHQAPTTKRTSEGPGSKYKRTSAIPLRRHDRAPWDCQATTARDHRQRHGMGPSLGYSVKGRFFLSLGGQFTHPPFFTDVLHLFLVRPARVFGRHFGQAFGHELRKRPRPIQNTAAEGTKMFERATSSVSSYSARAVRKTRPRCGDSTLHAPCSKA